MIPQLIETATQYHRAGRLHEAEVVYRQVLALKPDHADALHLLGLLALQTRRLDEAHALIQSAIAAAPTVAGFRVNLGAALEAAGDDAGATFAYRTAITLNPNDVTVIDKLGVILARTGQTEEAVAAFRRALEIQPNFVDAMVNLARVLCVRRSYKDAIVFCETALRLKPDCVPACFHLGIALQGMGRFEAAEAAYRAALALQPENALFFGHLGTVQFAAGRFDSAIASFQKMSELQPENAEAWSNLGITFKQMNRLTEGIAACRAAIAHKPDYPSAHLNLSVMLLSQGDFPEGWREYEWRFKSPEHTPPLREFDVPRWEGEYLGGKRLLLHAEQGFGDSIQFIRYAALVAQRGAEVIVECPSPLTRLLANVKGVSELVALGEPLPEFAAHCPLLSLPLLFGTTLDNIPSDVPYLHAEPEKRREWRRRLDQGGGSALNIGLCWAGHPRHPNDRRRSLPLVRLMPLLSESRAAFYSLQKGPAKLQAAEGASAGLTDWTDDLTDFSDTAALLSELDLVITVDTSIAHLAGALGKPVWVLLPFAADWRWLMERHDSPWYPTMRLFRQEHPGDWNRPLREVAEALAAALGSTHDLRNAVDPAC